jgi:hypothetical protein
MRPQGILVVVMAASITVTAAAQPPQTGQEKKSAQDQTVTVTGCLSNAAASGATARGTTGTGQTKGSEQQFLLTNATIGASPDKTAPAGTTGTGTTYRLTGGNREELQKYLNSRVEIRGTLQPRGESQAKEKPEQVPGKADAQMLRVTSVKQISPTCEAR